MLSFADDVNDLKWHEKVMILRKPTRVTPSDDLCVRVSSTHAVTVAEFEAISQPFLRSRRVWCPCQWVNQRENQILCSTEGARIDSSHRPMCAKILLCASQQKGSSTTVVYTIFVSPHGAKERCHFLMLFVDLGAIRWLCRRAKAEKAKVGGLVGSLCPLKKRQQHANGAELLQYHCELLCFCFLIMRRSSHAD